MKLGVRAYADLAIRAGAKEGITLGQSILNGRSRSSGPLVEDPIMPQQYLERRHRTELQGERRLLLAILESAVDDVQKYGRWRNRTAGRFAVDALAWIESDDTAPYSFEYACEALGLEPSYIRAGVRQNMEPALPPEVRAKHPWQPERIKALRRALHWPQWKFGKACGVAQSTVRQWEDGTFVPSPSSVVELARLEATQ
jgi:DNA-binding transcriptional regulator YiaG